MNSDPLIEKKHKGLVVDDEPLIREIIREALEAHGCDVIEACNGREALETLKAQGIEKFSFVISDIRMPKGSGLELTEKINLLRQGNLPLVYLLSGFSDLPEDSLPLGVKLVFPKPFKIETIVSTVTQNLT